MTATSQIINRKQHRRTPTSRYVVTYFQTERGLLFGSQSDLDYFTEDATTSKVERRADFPADAYTKEWYIDLTEYRGLNRASTAVTYKLWDNHNKTHFLNDAKDAPFVAETLTQATARLESELERTDFPYSQIVIERYVNDKYDSVAS